MRVLGLFLGLILLLVLVLGLSLFAPSARKGFHIPPAEQPAGACGDNGDQAALSDVAAYLARPASDDRRSLTRADCIGDPAVA